MLNTEQTLERVLRIARSLPETERQYFDFAQQHPVDCGKNSPAIGVQLSALVIDLRETIAAEEECRRGRAVPYAAAKRICKRTIERNSHRPSTRGAWIDADGKQCLCDGMTGVRLNSPFKLTVAPKPKCGERFDLDAVIRPVRLNSVALKSPSAALRAIGQARHSFSSPHQKGSGAHGKPDRMKSPDGGRKCPPYMET